jgi:PAS domain S-box-containing protein
MSDTAPLEHEIADLREALNEAYDICTAIRHGEVDAVVVGQSDEDKRVLLLSGAYARYRQLVEEMEQGAVTVSTSGDVLFANNSFARMMDEPLIELFRRPLEKMVAAADRERVLALLAPHAAQRSAEVTLVSRNRSLRQARLSVVTSGEDFVTLLVTDLSGDAGEDAAATLEAIRRGAVDAFVVDGKQVVLLDSAKSPYRALVERMRQGAVTVGPDGVVVYANERFSAMVALPHGRIVGTPLAELVAESDRAALQSMLSSRDSAQGELRLRAANGERPVMQASMTTLDAHKMFLFADLTAQKRHEAADERTRKFLGMLAHEFRNILGPIQNSALLLRQKPLDADARKALEIIERQTDRLLGLVEDLRRINPKD